MQAKIKYDFSGILWKTQGHGAWYFISLPKNISKEIRGNLQWQEEGWGRMKVIASIGKIEWKTSIWFDKKMEAYQLPIKTDIRERGQLKLNDLISASIFV